MKDSRNPFPMITVATVTYNAEKYIETTIRSVLEQEYAPIEFIVIDGKSTDATVKIIQSYDDNIHFWCSEKDQGAYDAMNKATMLANGRWINFMNAGDTFSSPDALMRLVEAIKPGTDIICGGVNYVYNNRSLKVYRSPFGLETIWKPQIPCIHQSALIKTEVMKQHLYATKYKIASDYDFFLKAYLNRRQYQFVDFPVSDFLVGGMSAQNQILGRAESINIMIENMDDPKSGAKENAFVHAFDHLLKESRREFADHFRSLHRQLSDIIATKKRIVIYGNGSIGRMMATFLGTERVAMIVDQFDTTTPLAGFCICHPSELDRCSFDSLIISAVGKEGQIREYLLNNIKLEPNRIIDVKL